MSQHLVLETSDLPEEGLGEGLPGSADVTVQSRGPFTFSVDEGPEDGTYFVTIEGEFTEIEVSGSLAGEPVEDAADIEELGTVGPVSATIVVDSRGRVLDDTTVGADALAFGLAPLSGLAGDLNRLVGPVLPAEPVAVGETWTETFTAPATGDEMVETTVVSTLSALETHEGRQIALIESTTSVAEVVVDLSEFFTSFIGAFLDVEEGTELELLEDVVFRIVMAPAETTSVTQLDVDSGLAIRSTTAGPSSLRLEAALPDEASGAVQSYGVSIDVTQSITYTLAQG